MQTYAAFVVGDRGESVILHVTSEVEAHDPVDDELDDDILYIVIFTVE